MKYMVLCWMAAFVLGMVSGCCEEASKNCREQLSGHKNSDNQVWLVRESGVDRYLFVSEDTAYFVDKSPVKGVEF